MLVLVCRSIPHSRRPPPRSANTEYPAYHTEAFAKAASTATEQVTLEDLTPGDADEDPQHGSHDDDNQDAYDDNLNDQQDKESTTSGSNKYDFSQMTEMTK